MFKLNLTARLFWLIAVVTLSVVVVNTVIRYNESQKVIQTRGYNRAKAISDYFASMRYVYHQQFLKSGLDLNDSTVGFLPAYAACLISDEFSKRTTQGVTVRNVSDSPRNERNRADEFDISVIKYFTEHPDQNESISHIKQNGQEFFFYASPLRIQPYCLECHGEKNKTLSYIQNRYDGAYGYKVGDIRGITSIRIPVDSIADSLMTLFWSTTYFAFGVSIALLVLVYSAIRNITRKEELYKKELEASVIQKTTELENAYANEKHLRSILRTVADVNQLLITTSGVDELIDKSVKTLSSNESFANAKILLASNKKLEVKASHGIIEDIVVTKVDELALSSNMGVLLSDLTADDVPEHCKHQAKIYGIKAIYSTPLRSYHYDKPIGVITICTKQESFSVKELEMIDELAGDIGFAINAFTQKEVIEKLNVERINNQEEFIDALVDMIEQRDTYTAGHTKRVATYSVMIAKELGLSEVDINKLSQAAKLHDIGKVVTPDSILLKPGALTKLEYELIKEHATVGYQVLSNIVSYNELANIMVYHHEKFDGSGYPNGKKGDEIPLLGYILAVADSFDAMTTNRIYKPRKNVAESIVELESLSGKWYYPKVVEAAVKVLANVNVELSIDQAVGDSNVERERLSYFFRDKLTKLYNEDYLTLVIAERLGLIAPKSLTLISLSNFTKYNKEHTWDGGNALLIEFANFLTANIDGSLIFRIWGDHFVIADCAVDIQKLLSDSLLGKNKVTYKIRTIYAPFDNLREE